MRRRDFVLGAAAAGIFPGAAFSQIGVLRKELPIQAALVASFNCGKCAAFDSRFNELIRRMEIDVVFAPVAEREDDYVVRAWYGLEAIAKDRTALRTRLYKLTQHLMMADPDIGELIEFLRLEGIEIPPEKMRERILAPLSQDRLLRAVHLASLAGVDYTPALVLTRGKQVLKAIENRDSSDASFIEACVAAKREYEA